MTGETHDSAIFWVNNLTVSPAEYSPQVSLRGACQPALCLLREARVIGGSAHQQAAAPGYCKAYRASQVPQVRTVPCTHTTGPRKGGLMGRNRNLVYHFSGDCSDTRQVTLTVLPPHILVPRHLGWDSGCSMTLMYHHFHNVLQELGCLLDNHPT